MSTEITPNVPLLLKTLEHIENHPEEWDQAHWHCSTTACFAGHAAVIDGGEWLAGTGGPTKSLMLGRENDPEEWVGADCIPVSERARHILGLTEEQAERLFAGSNTLDDLQAEVYRLAGDFDKLAQVAERQAIAAMNGTCVLPEAYADPEMGLDDAHLRWEDLQEAIREWQRAEDGEVDFASLEPQWRDAEVYTNHLRGLVGEAVNKLIGRKP